METNTAATWHTKAQTAHWLVSLPRACAPKQWASERVLQAIRSRTRHNLRVELDGGTLSRRGIKTLFSWTLLVKRHISIPAGPDKCNRLAESSPAAAWMPRRLIIQENAYMVESWFETTGT